MDLCHLGMRAASGYLDWSRAPGWNVALLHLAQVTVRYTTRSSCLVLHFRRLCNYDQQPFLETPQHHEGSQASLSFMRCNGKVQREIV
ncbi:hypothetical protein E2C01_008281 [Portunus trituberculatus]|uniref:Uncharacterized protein n=1 Tax=Portunus trituberculatus TaxID=210409 RepID=A0A5B7D1F5_PORTR|nr:hypothetical protein [Portunus trituberculatus]